MKKVLYTVCSILLVVLVVDGRAVAQTADIDALRAALARSEAIRDSVRDARARQQADVSLLSQKVDSLKQLHSGGVASGELAAALQQSLELVVALEQTLGRYERALADVAQLQDRLRGAYDREIQVRFTQLDPSDSVQVAQLRGLQQRRRALPETPLAMAVPIPEVVILPDDGFETVRQKTELMWDIAVQVQREVVAADARLKKLEEEQRLRNRVQQFSQELILFDEGLPEGRSVAVNEQRASENEPPQGGFETTGIVSPDEKEDVRGPGEGGLLGPETAPSVEGGVTTGREISLEMLEGLAPAPGEDALAFEIRQLKARRAALVNQEARVRSRAERLRTLLDGMRGTEP